MARTRKTKEQLQREVDSLKSYCFNLEMTVTVCDATISLLNAMCDENTQRFCDSQYTAAVDAIALSNTFASNLGRDVLFPIFKSGGDK